MKIGMIFPGQGSQILGMGKDFYDHERIVQELFEEASNCLDQNFVRLCFASSEKELRETLNAQTSIFLVSAAIYTVLNKKYGIVPSLVAGHSSGEYSAIYAADGMNFPDALYLLRKRSLFMEESTKKQAGGMLAVFGLSEEQLSEICCKYNDPSGNQRVAEIVNFNSSSQLVVSGTLPEIEQIRKDVKALKALKGKAIPLNVAGAFHSRLMKDAKKDFGVYMVKVDFQDLKIPLINNVDAKDFIDHEKIKASLVKQISVPVLWWQSMQKFKDMDLIVEVGPSDKLSKMLQREWPEKQIMNVSTPDDMEKLLNLLGKEIIKPEIEEEADDIDEEGVE